MSTDRRGEGVCWSYRPRNPESRTCCALSWLGVGPPCQGQSALTRNCFLCVPSKGPFEVRPDPLIVCSGVRYNHPARAPPAAQAFPVCCTPVPTRAHGTCLVLTMPLWTPGYDTLTVSGGTWGDTALVFISRREFRPFPGVWLRGGAVATIGTTISV